MYRRDDPRLRRTLNQLSQNIESANESAQESLFTFGQNYVRPCLSSIGSYWQECTGCCLSTREDRLRRARGRTRGRAELSFDFYDDWEEDENETLLDWGNDGFDRLLGSGSYGTTTQPNRERGMKYGGRKNNYPSGRRRSAVHTHEGGDPTLIPSSSYFGFFSKLPFKVGGKGLRYKPSAADLTDHPGALRHDEHEEEPLIEESEDAQDNTKTHRRMRSTTHSSGHTIDSLSSRGDIFPSEDELDDAVPIDDEFAMALERRTTGLSADDASSGRTRGKRPAGSRASMRTESSRSIRSKRRNRGTSTEAVGEVRSAPALSDLKDEELHIEQEQEIRIELKRDTAQKLAAERGLAIDAPQVFIRCISC
ncbi:hypothetical protein EJ05DRAFT_238641 [Pseudovirgaria hyperparasitica]|uniref:Uncharacterized protein n=1 Tax=Pseudovirgaria hyperparasitica TaxID=470096 RepID=A0A6A6VSQ6_9PEZI|nr:uncharacterized protein EJ05DRAFT_238641 [Pseudovirgaria hyperparasitica]KAF2752816.1 hypothetical protein EJ05DRAFT_238641 [Pseudovirgaria hyperparasitica]